MALTRLEAEDRANRIYGDTVRRIIARGKWAPGEWTIVLHNGTHHGFDGNGHTTCHPECAEAEYQLCQ